MPAFGEHERHFGIGKKVNLEHGCPWRDVIHPRADGEQGHAQIGERHRLSPHEEAALCKVVPEKEAAKVFGMHAKGHSRGICIPCHEVSHLHAVPEQIVSNEPGPDQVL